MYVDRYYVIKKGSSEYIDTELEEAFNQYDTKVKNILYKYDETIENTSYVFRYAFKTYAPMQDKSNIRIKPSIFIKNQKRNIHYYKDLSDSSSLLKYDNVYTDNYFDCEDWKGLIKLSYNKYTYANNPNQNIIVNIVGNVSYKYITNININKIFTPITIKDISSKDTNMFTRVINNIEYIILAGEIIRMNKLIVNKSLNIKKPKLFNNLNKISTKDIECININGELIPYAIGTYSMSNIDKIESSIYLQEYGQDCQNKIISHYLKIPKTKYFYIHNFDKFDSKYIIKVIKEMKLLFTFIPSGANGITSLTVSFQHKKSNFNQVFKDSYKLFPKSLKDLGIALKLKESKGIFPYRFMDSVAKQNYKGNKPDT